MKLKYKLFFSYLVLIIFISIALFLLILQLKGIDHFVRSRIEKDAQNFLENYPNSRYIIAYKNWLNLLNSVPISSEEPAVTPFRDQSDSFEINQLRIELNRVQA
ncbi:MAG: hypothetical protein KAV45_01140 [Calditrichia bacterium]|jgi:hypothetical protein|nr:hypothetical protein [Calditrichia bacterium]